MISLMTHLAAIAKRGACIAAAVAVACVLGGCTLQGAGSNTDEHAAENRQYMAQLNQKTGELTDVLEKFQQAVAADDVVGMKAQAAAAGKIIDQVRAGKATDSLKEIKDAYVDGLDAINTSMNAYVELYAGVQAGTVSSSTYERKLKAVQASYDEAVEKLKAADEELTTLANE